MRTYEPKEENNRHWGTLEGGRWEVGGSRKHNYWVRDLVS